MNTQLPYYRKILNDKLVERISKNQKYSLRAFAKALGLVSGSLSQILNGKRFLSEGAASTLLNRLDLSYDQRELFLTSLVKARKHAGLKRNNAAQKIRLQAPDSLSPSRELSADLFRTVSDWYHSAILELTRVENFTSEPKWIADRLGISEAEVIGAIDRLCALELLEVVSGKLTNTSFHLNTAHREITTAALKRRQKQVIEKSLYSLEHHPIEIRNHSARTVAIDPELIPEAKKRIETFMLELCDELASRSKVQIYELSVQLFPLEKNPNPQSKRKNEI